MKSKEIPRIASCGVVSAAGMGLDVNWKALCRGVACFTYQDQLFQGKVPQTIEKTLTTLRTYNLFKKADRMVLLGTAAVQEALLSRTSTRENWAVIAGSSRGAAAFLEKEHSHFTKTGKTSPSCSPLSSLGTFASLISQFVKNDGLSLSLSSTCTTGLHTLGMGYLYLKAGAARNVLCVCSESPLTPFTLQMLKSARVLAVNELEGEKFPMRPMHPTRSGMVAAEGATAILLTTEQNSEVAISGYGCATEKVSLTGVSEGGAGLALAIERALNDAQLSPADIQLIIGHGAATMKGDSAEWHCYKQVFGNKIPPLRFHKWCVGHSLGNSALFSVAMSSKQLQTDECFSLPYLNSSAHSSLRRTPPSDLQRILITSLGFGGNCAALILSRKCRKLH